jgi:hypothetical protein
MKYKLHISEVVRYYLIMKKRNRLDIIKRGDLRLRFTNFEINVKKLALNHQAFH